MKRVLFLVICIIGFSFCVNAASSKFEATTDLERELINGEFTVMLGTKGEDITSLEHKVAYNSKYLTLKDIYPLPGFEVSKDNETKSGKYSIVDINVTGESASGLANYAILTFTLSDKVKISKSADIFLYNYEALFNDQKYRSNGHILTIIKDSNKEISFLKKDITKETKLEYSLVENWMYLVASIIVVIIVVLIIFLIPSRRKKENPKSELKDLKKKTSGKNVMKIKMDLNEEEEVLNEDIPSVSAFNNSESKYK